MTFDVLAPAAGALLVVLALDDVFHTLFYPSASGRFSIWVFRAMWLLTARLGRRARGFSGPLSMVLVIASWVSLLALGWALVYWPSLADGGVNFASAIEGDERTGILTAVYYSWVTQATLGYGDITPADGVLRLLAPLQATIGFGVFTVAVTWVLSVYPALQRQRASATLVHGVLESHRRTAGQPGQPAAATLSRQLTRATDVLGGARVDYLQYPSTFYFASPSPTMALAAALLELRELAGSCGDHTAADVRLAAAELESAIESLLTTLGRNFPAMPADDTDAAAEAYRRHAGAA